MTSITTKNIIGRVSLPNNVSPIGAYVRFTMTGFDTQDGAEVTVIQEPVFAYLDAAGDISSTLWSNGIGTRNTYYKVDVFTKGDVSDRVYPLGGIVVPSTGTTFNLNDLLAIPTSIIDGPAYAAQAIAAAAAAEQDAIAAAASAASIAAAQTKLDGIEALADVTDTANVTAAGALMDSELANIVAVKAMNQGLATTNSPTFVDGNFTGDVTIGDDLLLTGPTPRIRMTDTDLANAYADIFYNSGVTYIDSRNDAANGPIVFRGMAGGVATNYGRFNSLGYLGLGTTTPAASLDIKGTGDTAPTIRLSSGETYTNSNSVVVPKVPLTGLLNIENNQLMIWPDISGDGDYDADIYTKSNMYLAAQDRIHLRTNIPCKAIDGGAYVGPGTNEGRLIIGNNGTTNYIQSAQDFAGVTVPNFGIGPEGSSAFWLFAESATGNVGIGKTTPQAKLHVNGDVRIGNPADSIPSNNASGNGLSIQSTGKTSILGDSDWSLGVGRHTTTGAIAYWYYGGAVVGNITVTGAATTYNTTSDYRLKENVKPLEGAIDIVMAMKPCTYTAKADGLWYDGFLAHELQEVYPLAVTGQKDEVDEDGKAVMQSVDYSKLTTVLTSALQEALSKIDSLQSRIEALETA